MKLRTLAMSTAAALLGVTVVQGPAAAAPPSTQAVVLSDSFESPAVPANSFTTFFAGQQMGVWTVTQGDVDLIRQNVWQAADGMQSLDLNGFQPGAVARTLSILPLVTYRISYALAGNANGGPAVKTGQVRVNGVVVQNFSFDTTGKSNGNMGYVQESIFVTVIGTSINLEFASTTTGSQARFGPVIDNVVVESCLVVIC